MNLSFSRRPKRGVACSWFVAVSCAAAGSAGLPTPCVAASAVNTVNITQHHNHPSRDGLYVDPGFTPAAAADLKRDLSFNGAISGNVYAQPLYLDNGPNGAAAVFVVTESNNVYALEAAGGNVIWQTNVAQSVPVSSLPCGNVNPVGIVGTPIIDLPSRTLFFDALATSNGTVKHLIFALNLDTGGLNSGWPVDVDAKVSFGNTSFSSLAQGQRGALGLLNGILYVPYGGNYGDCGTYHGWLVGVPLDDPAGVLAWATSANGGGAWAVGGTASDGTNVYLATGNTFSAATWGGGEAIIRMQPGPLFSGQSIDYWTPTNWPSLDSGDLDIGGSGPLLVTVPGATPANLVVALGKDGNAYLLNQANLGGVSSPLAKLSVSSVSIIQAAATYQTTNGTYVVFSANSQLTALRLGAANPPTLSKVWTASFNGRGSPFVTSTDGTNNVLVWVVGCEGDDRLHAFDGNTGAVIYSGGGASDAMGDIRRFNAGIVAHGHIYVAGDNQLYSFTLPVAPIVLLNPTLLPGNILQFGFTNTPGMSFTAFGTTNLSTPFARWRQLGLVPEVSPGQFQFTDSQDTTNGAFFYRVVSP
jgi:outer membrane protein assembly factor BamB